MSGLRITWEFCKTLLMLPFDVEFHEKQRKKEEERAKRENAERKERERLQAEAEVARRASLTPDQRRIEDLEAEVRGLKKENSTLKGYCREYQDRMNKVRNWAEANS